MKKNFHVIKFIVFIFILPSNLFAMHIMEGFLPVKWVVFWWALVIPFVFIGFIRLKKIISSKPELKLLLAMAGAFAFVLSALKLPSVTGSCSHPTGVGLGTLMFGPFPMIIIGLIVLLFQAMLLAHGGITTLGANLFSMALCGPFVTYIVYNLCKRIRLSNSISIFTAVSLGDIFTYLITALQLTLAHPDVQSGYMTSFVKFAGIFAITQIPLAISEGLLTVIVINILYKYALEEIKEFKIFNKV